VNADQKFKAILAHICGRNRAKTSPTPSQASKLARVAAARSAPAESAQTRQASRIVDAIALAQKVQVELARRFAPPAAVARTAPTKRADEPAAPVIVQPVPTVEKPLAPVYLYPVRSSAPIEMTAKELLARYAQLHGAEGLAFYREHSKEIDAARAGVRLDAGRFPTLSGNDRVTAALQRQFPARP
jgi:hypothetical protein